MLTINKVLLIGRVADAGPKLAYSSEAQPQCSFTLLVEEAGKDGATTFKLFVPVDVFGTQAEWVAEHINASDLVCVDGKLRWKSWLDKQGQKQGKLGVMAWQVAHLHHVASSSVSTN
jgi:single-stranded DNA-binding protein